MDRRVNLWAIPEAADNVMIVGWEQWADAGQISSGLPGYLAEKVGATRVGEIRPDGFYLFQLPGTHHLARPVIRLVDGHCEQMSRRKNDLYHACVGGKGLYIFAGEEPHLAESEYAEAFFDMVEAAHVKRVVALGGVFGAMPYDQDREVSCVYSLPALKTEMQKYAVKFSQYEGGSTIGTYLAHVAERRGIEFIVLYAFVPAYDFAHLGITLHGLRIEQDWKAWYDLLRRIDHMFGLGIDLLELEQKSRDLETLWHTQMVELAAKRPELKVMEYLEAIAIEFEERSFAPLDDAWDELGDLLGGMDE